MRAPLALYYIRHARAYTHYISTEWYGVQTEFTRGTFRSLHDWNRHRFRHRTHSTFGRYSPRHRRGKRSTTTRTQARSTALGTQGQFERPPWTIHTAPVYIKMDSSYTPFLQQVWCEAPIIRHVETQGGSAIIQLSGRSGLLFSRYIVVQNTIFSTSSFVETFHLFQNTLSLQTIWITQRAFIPASGYVIGFLVTFLLRNIEDGRHFVSTLHTLMAQLTLMKAGE